MGTILQDVRYAARGFIRAPGFTVVILATLAMAIGVNTTVFSFVNALLFSPPAGVRDPRSLVAVYTSDFSSSPYATSSIPDFESIKAEAPAFAMLAAFREDVATLARIGEGAERVRTMAVSADFFEILGVRPAAGRLLGASDGSPAHQPAAVIGHSLWQRAFGGSSILGTTLTMNGMAYTIVGVVPADFSGLNLGGAFDVWTPLRVTAPPNRGSRTVSIVGRLSAGADLRQAQAQLDGVAARLAAAYPETNRGTLTSPEAPRAMLVLPHTRMAPTFRAQVSMISGVLVVAVALVLLIACANVAGLLLSRATGRQREMAVRAALGASRTRLVRQMLTESVMLAAAGGALGLLVALWTSDVLPSFFPPEQARLLDARIDGRVLLVTASLALLSGLAFGLAPAFQGLRGAGAGAALRSDARSGEARAGITLRKLLVMAQVAMASVLLVSSILLTRSLNNALAADLGFSTRNAVLTSVELPVQMNAAAAGPYFDRLLGAVGALPGVEEAALARFVPVASTSRRGFRVEGYVPRPGEEREFHYNVVSAAYFRTMGIPAARGRLFEQQDRTGPPVAVVNQVFADRFYGGDAIGRRIEDSRGLKLEIIGVVRADRRLDIDDPSLPVVFYLLDQQFSSRMMLVARTSGDPGSLAETFRRTTAGVDRDVAVFRTTTLEAHLEEALVANQMIVALVTTCGGLALGLALTGVYGIVSFTVARRTREIGVRVALGATPRQILRLLATEHGTILALGLLVGFGAALAASRFLGSMLYGISATHASSYLLVLLIVGGVGALASLLPARRALSVNPVQALRHD